MSEKLQRRMKDHGRETWKVRTIRAYPSAGTGCQPQCRSTRKVLSAQSPHMVCPNGGGYVSPSVPTFTGSASRSDCVRYYRRGSGNGGKLDDCRVHPKISASARAVHEQNVDSRAIASQFSTEHSHRVNRRHKCMEYPHNECGWCRVNLKKLVVSMGTKKLCLDSPRNSCRHTARAMMSTATLQNGEQTLILGVEPRSGALKSEVCCESIHICSWGTQKM